MTDIHIQTEEEPTNIDPVLMIDPMMSDLTWDQIVATMPREKLLELLPLVDARANKFYNRGNYIRRILKLVPDNAHNFTTGGEL